MFDQITLRGGLRVVGEKLTSVRSCTVGVWVKVGSMNELPHENGLSHFIEHMVFKGTQKRTAKQIAQEMDDVGGQLNAFTSKDCTCFYAKVIDTDLKLAVDVLSDLALHPTFDGKELDKERGVVLEEISMVEDTPEDLVSDLLSEAQFEGALRMPILGTGELIKNYSRDALLGYWKRHYTADNMVVAIAGNYDWDAFVALVESYFLPFPNPNVQRDAQPLNRIVTGRAAKQKDTEQLHICLGYPGVGLGRDEIYALSVFNNALGGGMSSRLFQRIREELGMAYSIYSYPGSYPGCGVFDIYAGTNPENAETVLRELSSQIALVLSEGLTQREFVSAKAQLRGGYILGLESSSGRMQSIGRSTLLLNKLIPSEETISRIEKVTMDDVMRIARQILSVSPSVAIVGKNAQKYLQYAGE